VRGSRQVLRRIAGKRIERGGGHGTAAAALNALLAEDSTQDLP
jgi:hypothetical protein